MTARLLNSRYLSLLRVGNLTHPKHGRAFNAASRLMENPPIVTLPARKPIGAVRGGLFGFLLGAVSAMGGFYYYVLDEYKLSNTILTEDIHALQSAVQRLESYVKVMEDKVEQMARPTRK